METEDRLPTRVSKACDRCKRQKQRCDYERPCRHCARAQVECTMAAATGIISRKSRRRKQSSVHALTASNVGRPSASQSEAPETTSTPSHSYNPRTHHESDSTGQEKSTWDTSAISSTGGNQTSPSRGSQPAGGDSTLPNFESDSALAITRKIFRFQQSPAFTGRATFAIPGGRRRQYNSGTNSSNPVPMPLLPIFEIIGVELPPYDLCNTILDIYFSAVHWFSLVVYEPKFRRRYNTIIASGLASRNDHGFLLLLLMVLIMGCWYTPNNKNGDHGLSSSEMDALRIKLLKVVQRDFMDLMDEDCLEFVQLCTLLGSFYLYHGRPRSSFSMLGAATKTSQAMDLHRDLDSRWSFEDKEERIRVWWTVYTWDRPLGINDKDCNVPMPSEVLESVHFDLLVPAAQICLSTYQYQLNLVYKIASPLLEDIYGLRTSLNTEFDSQRPQMVATANQSLLEWYQHLPHSLSFDLINDLSTYSSTAEKMHHLQALSLQLTYDNLIIVLNRPLLSAREHQSTSQERMPPNVAFSDRMHERSFEKCFNSALRISNLQHKPNLFTLARTTHLVSFLGMNLFTASVVLFICALSDTLSDTAQEAKRALKRTLQMQKSLSNYASLSLQCGRILEDLVQLILKKEMEDMLQDHSNDDANTTVSPSIPELLHGDDMTQLELTPNQTESNTRDATAALDPTNVGTSHEEVSHFKQSLETLQKVFYDPIIQRQQTGMDGDLRNGRNYGDFTPADDSWNQGGMMNSHNTGFDDNIFTSVEDLGQFWLWDVNNLNF